MTAGIKNNRPLHQTKSYKTNPHAVQEPLSNRKLQSL